MDGSDVQEPLSDLLPGPDGGPERDDAAYQQVRERVQALISAARGLSDTCADLADALRPVPGHAPDDPLVAAFGRLRAERTAALLDEAASAARGTLGLLHSAYGALDRVTPPSPRSGATTWPDAFVEVPPRAFALEDETGTAVSIWGSGETPAVAADGRLKAQVTDVPADGGPRAEVTDLLVDAGDGGPRAEVPDLPGDGGPKSAVTDLPVDAVDGGPRAEVTDLPGDGGPKSAVTDLPGDGGLKAEVTDLPVDAESDEGLRAWAPDPPAERPGAVLIAGSGPDSPRDVDLPAGSPAADLAAGSAGPPEPGTGAAPARGALGGTTPDPATDTVPAQDPATDGIRSEVGREPAPAPDLAGPDPVTDTLAAPAIHATTATGTAQDPARDGTPGQDGTEQESATAEEPEPEAYGYGPEDVDGEGLRAWATSSVRIPVQTRNRLQDEAPDPAADTDRAPAADPVALADADDHPEAAGIADAGHPTGAADATPRVGAEDAGLPTVEDAQHPAAIEETDLPTNTGKTPNPPTTEDTDLPAGGADTDLLTGGADTDLPAGGPDTAYARGADTAHAADADTAYATDADTALPAGGADTALTAGVADTALPAGGADTDLGAGVEDTDLPAGADDTARPAGAAGHRHGIGNEAAERPDGASVEDTDADDPARITSAALAGWIVVDPDDADDPGRPIRPGAVVPTAPVYAATTAPDRLDARIPAEDDLPGADTPSGDPLGPRTLPTGPHAGTPFGDPLGPPTLPTARHADTPLGPPAVPTAPHADIPFGGPDRFGAAVGDPLDGFRAAPEPVHPDDGPGWHGDTVSAEPRSLSLVPPVPEGPETIPPTWRDDRIPTPADPWAAGPAASPWEDDPMAGVDLSGAATFARVERPVWTAEPVPGSSVAGDGLAVFPIGAANEAVEPAPAVPLDEPAAAVISRQVEAARRHLQAALVVANGPSAPQRLGALLTAIEQVLTAVTDLARETRGVLESGLADRTFPGEARFLCSPPWDGTQLVGRDAYGDDVASPAGLAKLLRALGYEAHSTTSSAGVAGVQIRSDRYEMQVALVEPAGGGRQRWSGALEWKDGTGASRTWAETLGPVELEDEELARRVDELLRRSVGG